MSQQAIRYVLLIIAAAIVASAVWISGQAIVENMRFAQGTNQILQLIGMAHNLAARDKNFVTQPNEDVLDDLTRGGLLSAKTDTRPVTIQDPWRGIVKSFSPAPGAMRIEADMPKQACRRLAVFLIKNSSDLGLTTLEVRGDEDQPWQRFFPAALDENKMATARNPEDACNQASPITIAMIFTVQK